MSAATDGPDAAEPSGDGFESSDAAAGLARRRRTAAHVFVDPDVLDADTITPDADVDHHLSRVVRLDDGDAVSVSDGSGRWRIAVVAGSRSGVRLEPSCEVVVEPRRHAPLTLATAMPKGDRLEWLVQKATELGADRIQLLHARHSVVRWKQSRVPHQIARLERIAREAARQSRRVWSVDIAPPRDAIEVLPSAVVAEPGGRRITSRDDVVAVGPEGGWSDDELRRAKDRIDLGPHILRTETAGLAAIALCVATRH